MEEVQQKKKEMVVSMADPMGAKGGSHPSKILKLCVFTCKILDFLFFALLKFQNFDFILKILVFLSFAPFKILKFWFLYIKF